MNAFDFCQRRPVVSGNYWTSFKTAVIQGVRQNNNYKLAKCIGHLTKLTYQIAVKLAIQLEERLLLTNLVLVHQKRSECYQIGQLLSKSTQLLPIQCSSKLSFQIIQIILGTACNCCLHIFSGRIGSSSVYSPQSKQLKLSIFLLLPFLDRNFIFKSYLKRFLWKDGWVQLFLKKICFDKILITHQDELEKNVKRYWLHIAFVKILTVR